MKAVACATVVLSLVLLSAGVARSTPIVAGTLFVELDAQDGSAGTGTWNNTGTLADFDIVLGSVSVGSFGLAGQPGVVFTGGTAYRGPIAPSSITGGNPRTIEVWAFNPTVEAHETVVAWGRRGGPTGSNLSFTYGSNTTHGAVGHWGAPDMPWTPVPAANQWHHLVYTYDGTAVRLYVNGALNNVRAAALATHDGLPINLGAQNADAAANLHTGERFSGALGTLRVHDGALSPAQVQSNFLLDAARYGQTPPPPPPPPIGLVSLWQFDDGGQVGVDSMPRANHLTAEGDAAQVGGGRRGGALQLDGAGDRLVADAFPTGVPTGNSSYSVAAWIKPTASGDRGIIGWGNYGGSRQVNALRLIGANGLRHYWWAADLDASDAQVNAVGVNMHDGEWHHVTAVYDNQNGTRSLYVDGQLVTFNFPGGNNAQPLNFRIGQTCHFCGTGEFFAGMLDDVAVFDVPLSGNQIATIMTGNYGQFGGPVPEPSAGLMVAIGLGALVVLRRRIRRSRG